MFNGEILIRKVLQETIDKKILSPIFNNNFFIFEISNFIKTIASYRLTQRRKLACNECDPQCINRNRRSLLVDLENDEEIFYLTI